MPLDDVVAEIERRLAAGTTPDYITISGSGEPTLYSRLGELIAAIKARTAVPVAVITNGSLLWQADVRAALREADLVMPSLDAGDELLFQRVNRPHPELAFEQVVSGLIAFRAEFSKPLWLEIFLLAETSVSDVEKLVALVQRIAPDRIQLNTVARPPAEASAVALPPESMARFAAMFGDKAESIAPTGDTRPEDTGETTREHILAMLKRRPCSLEDIASGLAVHRAEVSKHLGHLMEMGAVHPEVRGAITYFVADAR